MKLMVQPQDGVKPLIDGIHRARSPNFGRVTGKPEVILLKLALMGLRSAGQPRAAVPTCTSLGVNADFLRLLLPHLCERLGQKAHQVGRD